MDQLRKKLLNIPPSKDNLRKACTHNGIKLSYLTKMSVCKAKKIIKKLIVIYKQNISPSRCNWFENQLKLFRFILILFSAYYLKPISEFNNEQWTFLHRIFRHKPQDELQYEAMKFLTNKAILKKRWCSEEEQILINFIRKCQIEPDWNQIAIQLYICSSRQFFRTPKQCKERWLNHLDPEVKHGNWTIDQDRILIKNVYEMGKKWSAITKELSSQRTQHMVKNRFMSLLLKAKKKFPSIIQQETLMEEIGKQIGLSLSEHQTQKQKYKHLRSENGKKQEEKNKQQKQEEIFQRMNKKEPIEKKQQKFSELPKFSDGINANQTICSPSYILPSNIGFPFPQPFFEFRNLPCYPFFFPSSN